MPDFTIDPKKTALVLIDLQQGIVSRQLAPYPAQDVVKKGAVLAARFRDKGAMVVYVRVDLADMLKLSADKSQRDPNAPPPPPSASELAPESGVKPDDIIITKRQWGAFFGTDLEQQLHQHGIKTIVLTGIATNFGVESTARQAWELGYEVILIEDAATSMSAELHDMAIRHIFPRIARVAMCDGVGLSAA